MAEIIIETEKLEWHCHPMAELDAHKLWSMFHLRQQVFILEQQCLYPDIDELDTRCFHLLACQADSQRVIACARLIPPGCQGAEPRIGRFVVAQAYRGNGLGRALLQQALQWLDQHYAGQAIMISAQHHLAHFYQQAGFVVVSEPYDEDGILHIDMRRLSW